MRKFTLLSMVVLTSLFTGLVPAKATPPQYIAIHDTPIAVNATHLFLFRTLDDNEGSHYIRNTIRFLISQELDTGRVDQMWALDETRVTTIEMDEPSYHYQRLNPVIDPFEIMDQNNAVPLAVSTHTDWSGMRVEPRHKFQLTEEGIVDISTDGGELFLGASDIRERIKSGLDVTLETIVDENGLIDATTLEQGAYSTALSECLMTDLAANIPKHDLFRLECESGEYAVLSYLIYLSIPDRAD